MPESDSGTDNDRIDYISDHENIYGSGASGEPGEERENGAGPEPCEGASATTIYPYRFEPVAVSDSESRLTPDKTLSMQIEDDVQEDEERHRRNNTQW